MSRSSVERIAVVGSGRFADAVAETVRRSSGHELAGLVGPASPLPTGASLVVSVAEPAERVGVLRTAVAAGLLVVTLPLADGDQSARQAVAAGRVAQVSPLRGFAAVETLRAEARQGTVGQSYGVFATHRVRRGRPDLFEQVGLPLLHLAFDLMGEPPVNVQVTSASLFSSEADAWYLIVRGSGGFLATVEFGALLPENGPAAEQILIELTGSEAVLRAEPTRQTIRVARGDGITQEIGWWVDPARRLVTAALASLAEHDVAQELNFLKLVAAVREAAETGRAVAID